MVNVSEYSRFEILTAILNGWKEVTMQEIPKYLIGKLDEMVAKLDNLLQSMHLDQVKELAFHEGILIAKGQLS